MYFDNINSITSSHRKYWVHVLYCLHPIKPEVPGTSPSITYTNVTCKEKKRKRETHGPGLPEDLLKSPLNQRDIHLSILSLITLDIRILHPLFYLFFFVRRLGP